MNWKLFIGLATGIAAYTVFLLWSNTAKAEMLYPQGVFFSKDLRRMPCAVDEPPYWACVGDTIRLTLPKPDPRKVMIRMPKPDPRKIAAAN